MTLPVEVRSLVLLLSAAMLLTSGCTADRNRGAGAAAESETTTGTEAATNRIYVPEAVRANLGIRFAKVEARQVAGTLRMPGRFEALPSARREYRTPLSGRIELLVHQYDQVTTGTPLYRLDSPEWRRLQQEMAEAAARMAETSSAVTLAEAALHGGERARGVTEERITAGERHVAALRESLKVAEDRVAQLEKVRQAVGGMAAQLSEARAQAASARTALTQAEEEKADLEQQRLQLATGSAGAFATTGSLESALRARLSEYEAARLRLSLARATARSVLQVSDKDLDRKVTPGGIPMWQALDEIEIRAAVPGVVEKLEMTSGAYADSAAPVLSTIDPQAVRFRAVGLQSDLGKFENGMKARIVPPRGGSVPVEESIPGTLSLALESDPEERTLDLIIAPEEKASWARAGVTAFAEAVLDETEDPEPAVPVSAVVQDELEKVIFRRDPDAPDQVMRIEADLGVSDGHWVTLQSGVAAGDEVVTEGAYQLKLAGSGKLPEGAHVHADGTVHVGEH